VTVVKAQSRCMVLQILGCCSLLMFFFKTTTLSMLTVSLFKRGGRKRFQVPSELNIRISILGRDALATDVVEKSVGWFIRNVGIHVYQTTRRHIPEHRNVHFTHSFLYHTTGPQPLLKPVLDRERSSASSCNFQYPLFSLRSTTSSSSHSFHLSLNNVF
jgi:hypothetical protein